MRIEVYYGPDEVRQAAIIKAFTLSVCQGIPLVFISHDVKPSPANSQTFANFK